MHPMNCGHSRRAAWHSQRLMRDWQLRRDLLQGFSDPEFQQKRKDQCSKIVCRLCR